MTNIRKRIDFFRSYYHNLSEISVQWS